MYISETTLGIRYNNGAFYGNEGLIDAALGLSEKPLLDAYYGTGLHQTLRDQRPVDGPRSVDIAEQLTNELYTLFDLTNLISEIKFDLGKGDVDTDERSVGLQDRDIYENNQLYKALIAIQDGIKTGEDSADKLVDTKQGTHAQYLHKQLDEAARYYKSKHHKLIEALNKKDG